MNQLQIQTALWHLRAYANKLGLLGLFGVFLIICAFFIAVYHLPVIKQTNHELKMRIQQQATQQQNAQKALDTQPPPPPKQDDFTDFYQHFESANRLPKVLAQINSIATKEKLVLSLGEYQFVPVKVPKKAKTPVLNQYEIIFPVSGTYTQIHRFIAAVLQAQPSLALTELRMERDTVQQPLVDAELVFVVYVKENA